MRYLIAAALVLSCSLCMAEEKFPSAHKIKSLTAEQCRDFLMVQQYVRKQSNLYLDSLTKIDMAVASQLANWKGFPWGPGRGTLKIGLTSIDRDVAKELAKFRGGYLCLNDLTSIDAPVAQELMKYKGHLDLDGVTSIDKEVARQVAKFEGKLLSFRSLGKIDRDVAEELAKYRGSKYFQDEAILIEVSTPVDEVTLAYLNSNSLIDFRYPNKPK